MEQTRVLVTGADIDGQARGKWMNASKFKSVKVSGFGFCNVIFAWDLHDLTYSPKTPSMLKDAGFSDILALVDETTFRTCPLTGVGHYLVDFYNPITRQPLSYCPRYLGPHPDRY